MVNGFISIRKQSNHCVYQCSKTLWHSPQAFGIIYNLYSEAIKLENKEYTRQNALFSKATAFIFEHYTEPTLSVRDIAIQLNISEVHLRRLFKSSANTSPIKYINFLRLERAKNMLLTSNYSIVEIAHSIGFDDPYYFSRPFKKETGFSPTEYLSTHL